MRSILLALLLFLVSLNVLPVCAQTIRELETGENGPWIVRVIVDSTAALRGTRVGGVTGGALLGTLGDSPLLFGFTNNQLPETSIYRLIEREYQGGIKPPRILAWFEEQFRIALVDVFDGDVVAGDLDGDGKDDIVMTGRTLQEIRPDGNVFGAFTGIYYNRAVEEPEFIAAVDHGLPPLGRSSIGIADFNGDGVDDIVLGGQRLDGSRIMDVFMGTSNAGPFEPSDNNFEGLAATTIATGDFDGDGDMDFVAGGWIDDNRSVVRLYENDGAGSFTMHPDVLPDLFYPSAEFGDLDRDGDDDLILTGGHIGPSLIRGDSRMYLSENGRLTELDIDLPGLFLADAGIADRDGDGDMDFFLAGVGDVTDTQSHLIYFFEREGDEYLLYPTARGLVYGGAEWIDYDGNGRKEIIITGGRYNENRAIIYEIVP